MHSPLLTYLLVLTIVSTWLRGSHGRLEVFEKIDGKLYYINTDKVGWFEAFQRCRTMKGDLVNVENDSEREILANYLTEKFTYATFWTGVNNLAEEGFYSTKTNAPINFTFWMPNRLKPQRSCVVLQKQHSNYYMRAVQCDRIYGFICDFNRPKQFVSEAANPVEVPTDLIPSSKADQFIRIGPKYYFIETKKYTYFQAYFKCRGMNAHLTAIENNVDREYLVDFWLKQYHTEPFWIGGYDYNWDFNYRWEKTYQPVGNKFWIPGEPSIRDTSCLKIVKQNGKYLLHESKSTTQAGFICESRLPPQPNPLTSFMVVPAKPYPRTGSNYVWIANKLYYISSEEANWFTAQQRCREMNLYLFAWENESQWRAMNNFFKKYRGRNMFKYWTGISDLYTYKQCVWEKNNSFRIFYGWKQKIFYRHQSCLCFDSSEDDIGTRNVVCQEKYRFICQE